ncbi:unnamed protein product, partial [Sphacelaria rigidula]
CEEKERCGGGTGEFVGRGSWRASSSVLSRGAAGAMLSGTAIDDGGRSKGRAASVWDLNSDDDDDDDDVIDDGYGTTGGVHEDEGDNGGEESVGPTNIYRGIFVGEEPVTVTLEDAGHNDDAAPDVSMVVDQQLGPRVETREATAAAAAAAAAAVVIMSASAVQVAPSSPPKLIDLNVQQQQQQQQQQSRRERSVDTTTYAANDSEIAAALKLRAARNPPRVGLRPW